MYRLFGLMIIASSFQMEVVRKNFLFLMTGTGKAAFNIFVGTLCFITSQKATSYIMGTAMILSGCVFIFFSKYKEMSDEDLNRAVSVSRGSVNAALAKTASNNKDVIYQAAYDNKEVIG